MKKGNEFLFVSLIKVIAILIQVDTNSVDIQIIFKKQIF